MENVMNNIYELQYAMDTFYFLVCGALVMWMAAGFAMLEAGLVRAKNTTEILTKNVALFAISCTMYLVCGYEFMYGGGFFLSGTDNVSNLDVASVLAASAGKRFRWRLCIFRRFRLLLPSGIRCNSNVYRIGCSRGAYEALGFLAVRCCNDWFHLPNRR